ncbi:MAG: hypothetical protein BGO69_15940 [Bacteroidetes bacterium 46-16]|nr:MAG: hypothetical protein BGO69_15940 [Bacteroidetes bacterium 46-16]
MTTILLEGAANNWLPLLLLLIALLALGGGISLLVHRIKTRKARKHRLSGFFYDGILDELH